MHDAAEIDDRRRLLEDFGLLSEQHGGTRMGGRVLGWLLLCDPPTQSLTQIADGLAVSKAAVSGAARELVRSGAAERASEPGRRGDSYRACRGKMDGMLHLEQVRFARRILQHALAAVADGDQTQPNYVLLRELHDLAEFLEGELPGLLARWEERSARNAAPSGGDSSHDEPLTTTGGTT